MGGLAKFFFGGIVGAVFGFLISPKRAQKVREALLGGDSSADARRLSAPHPQEAVPVASVEVPSASPVEQLGTAPPSPDLTRPPHPPVPPAPPEDDIPGASVSLEEPQVEVRPTETEPAVPWEAELNIPLDQDWLDEEVAGSEFAPAAMPEEPEQSLEAEIQVGPGVRAEAEEPVEAEMPAEGDHAVEAQLTAASDQPEEPRLAAQPGRDEPPAVEVTTAEPTAEELSVEEPMAEAYEAEEPTAEEPTAGEPGAEEPTAGEPGAEEPTAEEPVAEGPVVAETPSEESWLPTEPAIEGLRPEPALQEEMVTEEVPVAEFPAVAPLAEEATLHPEIEGLEDSPVSPPLTAYSPPPPLESVLEAQEVIPEEPTAERPAPSVHSPADLKARIEETRRRIRRELAHPFSEEPEVAAPSWEVSPEPESPFSTAPEFETYVAEILPEPELASREEEAGVYDEAALAPAAAEEQSIPSVLQPEPVAEEPEEPEEQSGAGREQPQFGEPSEDAEEGAPVLVAMQEDEQSSAEGEGGREALVAAIPGGGFDHEAMRRRIEETRNRLKAKAFDAMMSGEGALLRESKAEVQETPTMTVDSDVDATIETALTEEDF